MSNYKKGKGLHPFLAFPPQGSGAPGGGSGSGAPDDAEYVVLSTNGTLLNERVLTAGTNITITDAGAGSTVTVKMAQMAANTIKGNNTAGAADPTDIAVGANTVLGRVAGNIVAAQLVTGQITDDAVTYAKIQDVSATDRILGRDTAGAGIIEELTVSGGLEFTGTGIQRSALTSDVTAPAGSNTTTIANNAVTNAKAADMAANTIKGNDTAGSTDPTDIAIGANTVLGRVAGNIVAAQLATGQVANDAITYAKIQNVANTDRLLGRDTAGAGDIEELTATGGIEFTGTGIQTSAFTGDVTKAAGGTAQTIANDAVTFAKFQNITDQRILGRNAGSSGDVQEISLADGISFDSTTIMHDAVDYASKHIVILEEFFYPVTSAASTLVVSVSGAGSAFVNQTTPDGRYVGVGQGSTGTTTTGRAGAMMDNSGKWISFIFGIGTVTGRMFGIIPVASTAAQEYILRLGFIDSLTGNPVDGVWFEYDRLTSVNWRICASNNSTATKTTSSRAFTTDENVNTKFEIVVNAAGTSADFLINDVSIGTVTTNIPTTVGGTRDTSFGGSIIKSAGTTNRDFYMFYLIVDMRLTTTR